MDDASAYETLRYQARKKRDEAITAARDEYLATVENINRLARQIAKGELQPVRREVPTLGELILRHAPGARPFTIKEMVGWLSERHPGQTFRLGSVRTAHHLLAERGKLRRIDRNPEGHTLWALVDSRVIEGPWGMMTLTEAIEGVLRDQGPQRVADIAVKLNEQGFRPYVKIRDLYHSIYQALGRNHWRFQQDADGRWGLARPLATCGR